MGAHDGDDGGNKPGNSTDEREAEGHEKNILHTAPVARAADHASRRPRPVLFLYFQLMIRPPLLAPGARVALVCPSGPLRDEADLARAVGNAKRLGWEPVAGAHVLSRSAYFAGTDAERLSDLNAAFRNRTMDGVWCIRGGFGAMRLLEALDYDAIGRRPRAVIGYSDITALHAAIGARSGLGTFHGPTARSELTEFSRDSLE